MTPASYFNAVGWTAWLRFMLQATASACTGGSLETLISSPDLGPFDAGLRPCFGRLHGLRHVAQRVKVLPCHNNGST
jgi:hypothetical protein